MTGLSEILAGNTGAPEPAPTPPAPPPDPAPEPEPPREPEPPGDTPAAPGPQDPSAPPPGAEQDSDQAELGRSPHVPLRALHDERKKRQELERRLAEMERIAAPPRQPEPPPPRPDLFENPDGALDHLEQRITERVEQRFLAWSERQARASHPDIDEALDSYRSLAASLPGLHQQVMASDHPWEQMYEVVQQSRRAQKLQQLGDPDEWAARKEAEIRARVEAEVQAAQQSRTQQIRASLPQTLATARDTSGRFTARPPDPGSIGDILAAGRR